MFYFAYTVSPKNVQLFIFQIQFMLVKSEKTSLKGELNIDKKWQSDDLFYMIMNEICPRVDQF